MAACHGQQHTSLCGISVLLCALFHVHLHLAHASDMNNGSLPGNFTRLLFEKHASGDVMTLDEFEGFLNGIRLGEIHDQTTSEDSSRSDNHDSHSDTHDSHSDDHDAHSDNHDSHNEDETQSDASMRAKRSLMGVKPSINRRSIKDSKNHHHSIHNKIKRDIPERHTRATVRRDTSHEAEHLNISQCFTSDDYLSLLDSNNLTIDAFHQLFPAFLHQLDSQACESRSVAHHDHREFIPFWSLPVSVWLCSLGAITVISLVGLLSVAIIPLTSKVIYNHLLQFLVALAIGSLTGDACLHLLPHALSSAEHSHEEEGAVHDQSAVYKGLVALSGIYFFFLVERLMKMYSAKKREAIKKRSLRNNSLDRNMVADDGNLNVRLNFNTDIQRDSVTCEKDLIVVHKDVKDMAQVAHNDVHRNCDVDVSETVGGHGHAHAPVPRSIAQVAWMVIMGDGIHNFGDGLAIGAAFASSISVGLSTTLAVFCHELPHEIGDFAVLLRAGMSAKQAIVYNIVSSVFALIGMFIGIMVGNLSSASLWIFALIGGMFIYVALVDMMPELTAMEPQSGEHPMVHFLLQNAGMLLGFAIMFLIAIYEDDISFSV